MIGSFDSRLGADREFRTRMVLALALVVALPFVFVYALVFLGSLLGVDVSVSPLHLAVVVLVGLALQYRFGPRAVIKSVGARHASAEEFPDLHASVTRLAAQADTAKPDLAVSTTDLPNAFAVDGGGRAIVVTTGLLERLDEEELEAVLAHELAHLKNRDASLMTVAWLLPAITYYLTMAAFSVFYYPLLALIASQERKMEASKGGILRLAPDPEDSRRKGPDAREFAVMFGNTMVTFTLFAWFWIGSSLVYLVLSRQREYAADRAAATITGSPAALAGALETLDEAMPSVPEEDLRRYDGGTEALYLVPLRPRSFDSHALPHTNLFPDTHPPTRDRIERLRELAGERH